MTMGRKYCAIDAAIALSLSFSSSFVAGRTAFGSLFIFERREDETAGFGNIASKLAEFWREIQPTFLDPVQWDFFEACSPCTTLSELLVEIM